MSKSLRPGARAAQLLAAMTPSQKLALLSGVDTSIPPYDAVSAGYAGYVPGNGRLCLPPLTLNDGGAGVADGQIGTTAFPAPIAQAATWNPRLQRAIGATMGLEAWRKGIDVLLAPDVNIARVPENGRNFEAFGEDPFLAAQTAVAEIAGIQQNPVIATIKHYPVNSQETNRYSVSENLDDRALREIYLPPFEAAIHQASVGAVMCAYGLVNGVYSCQDPRLLGTLLRKELGYDGIVMSDWNATRTSAASANTGLDLVMPTNVNAGPLAAAVAAGAVSASTVNAMARRILTTMFRLGVFDRPPPPRKQVYLAGVSTAAGRGVARRAAEEGIVLLKNAAGTLPLRVVPGKTIAVIGQPADGNVAPYVSGGGSAYVSSAAISTITPLQGLAARAAKAGASVLFADGTDPAAAAALAARSSVAIVFAYDQESEGVDRPGLELPGAQDQLVEQVAQANPHTVVVLNTGGPVLMPWLSRVAAVAEAWYPGQEDGKAIAAILFGDVDPSGKLPQTFPANDTALPTALPDQWPGAGAGQDAAFSEGIYVGYRWFDAKKVEPLFPFGYGLSYTRFAYHRLRVRRIGANVAVSFTVKNTGTRAGAEVAQLYVDQPRAAGEPPRQLRGYKKVFLEPHRSATVTLTLTPPSFAHWDASTKRWRVAPGLHRILVGASSRDIRLRGFVRR